MGMWSLTAATAHLSCGPLKASLPLESLEAGISAVTLHGAACPGRFLGIDAGSDANGFASWKLADFYARHETLSASYQMLGDLPLRLHVDWHVMHASSESVRLNWVGSLETDLLDIAPTLHVGSVLSCATSKALALDPTNEVRRDPTDAADWEVVDAAWNERPAGRQIVACCAQLEVCGARGWHYGELVIPQDFHGSVRRVGDNVASSSPWHWLHAGEPLEKGVIRRLQLCAIWSAGPLDVSTLGEIWLDLSLQPPPLTT